MKPYPNVTPLSGVPELKQDPVPQPGWEKPQDWFFTFGWDHHHPITGQPLRKSFVRLHGTCDGTREEMLGAFGNRWANQYESAERAGVTRFGLVEVPLPGREPVDDEELREAYAQDELDQDRVPTEDGFDVWKSLRRAVGQAEPPATEPVTPAEARTGISDVQAAVRETVTRTRSLLARLRVADRENARQPSADLAEAADDIAAAIDNCLDRIESWAGGGKR